MTETSVERALGRVEGRLADLSQQVTAMRRELSDLVHAFEASHAAGSQRLTSLESFRRWTVGLLTGIFLSGAAMAMKLLFSV